MDNFQILTFFPFDWKHKGTFNLGILCPIYSSVGRSMESLKHIKWGQILQSSFSRSTIKWIYRLLAVRDNTIYEELCKMSVSEEPASKRLNMPPSKLSEFICTTQQSYAIIYETYPAKILRLLRSYWTDLVNINSTIDNTTFKLMLLTV